MRQDFVANVSHELKTPLASIKAYTETLLDWALHDEEVNARFLRRIEEQAERLERLILDLLDLARLDSGMAALEPVPLALGPVVRHCVESVRGRAEAKGQALTLDLGPLDDATVIVADEEALLQILDNLLDNAVKYTPRGGLGPRRLLGLVGPRRDRGRRLGDRHPAGRPAEDLRAVLSCR